MGFLVFGEKTNKKGWKKVKTEGLFFTGKRRRLTVDKGEFGVGISEILYGFPDGKGWVFLYRLTCFHQVKGVWQLGL